MKPRLVQPPDHDSPTVRAMRMFRLKNPKDYKVRGISDRLEYKPYTIDDEIRGKIQNKEHGMMVPKGNPYHISKNSEVILTKEKLVNEK